MGLRRYTATHIGVVVGTSVALVTGCSHAAVPLTVGEAKNGSVLTIAVGQRVLVQLNRTTWTFEPPDGGGIVRQDSAIVSDGPVTCRAEWDCGSVSVLLIAEAPGDAVVRATQKKCGELVICSRQQGAYQVVIRVRA